MGLDARVLGLPGGEIDVELPASLIRTRCAWQMDLELVGPTTFGNAACLPQEILQAAKHAWVADVDVQAATRSGVAATESRFSL